MSQSRRQYGARRTFVVIAYTDVGNPKNRSERGSILLATHKYCEADDDDERLDMHEP